MQANWRNAAASFTLASALLIAGCKSSSAPAPGTNPDGTPVATQPQPGSTPAPAAAPAAAPTTAPAPAATPAPSVATRPRESAPTASSAPPVPAAPRYLTVPAQTRVSVSLSQSISSKTANVGEGFSGSLASPISVDGTTVFRRGTPVSGSVIAAHGQGRFKGEGTLGI